jgi:hypothetical protein
MYSHYNNGNACTHLLPFKLDLIVPVEKKDEEADLVNDDCGMNWNPTETNV